MEYERLKAELFDAQCEHNKARQLFITIKHDFQEVKKLLADTRDYEACKAQLVRS